MADILYGMKWNRVEIGIQQTLLFIIIGLAALTEFSDFIHIRI